MLYHAKFFHVGRHEPFLSMESSHPIPIPCVGDIVKLPEPHNEQHWLRKVVGVVHHYEGAQYTWMHHAHIHCEKVEPTNYEP